MKETYEQWQRKVTDPVLKEQLNSLSEEERHECFYRPLEFGTGGLRGVLGVGTNRMNIHVVARATQGYSQYLNENFENPSVAVAYDSRINSTLFAKVASEVFAGNGIKVYFYPHLMPTPALSFAVRELKCQGGIVVTASHNPAKYNGYKVYGPDGCQVTTQGAKAISKAMESVDYFDGIKTLPFDKAEGKIQFIGQETIDRYQEAMARTSLLPKEVKRDLSIVYTPLHGAGISCVPDCLKGQGFDKITLVEEQKEPDGNFPTCPFPNPEERDTLALGLDWSQKVNSDLLLATDPDCDRVGIAVRHQGDYPLLSGNQTGVLLLDFICLMRQQQNTMPQNPVAVKTIVTTPMAESVAKDYGVSLVDVLTGFKYIGEQIGLLEDKSRYIFGFEESYGYLSTPEVRDKDAVNASLLICEMVAYWKSQGKTLVDRRDELYEKYGFFQERLLSFAFEGSAGFHALQDFMKKQRATPDTVLNRKVLWATDFETGIRQGETGQETMDLPKSNVLRWEVEGGSTLILRPSGTEPKLKIYLSVAEKTAEESTALLDQLEAYFRGLL